jgi:hypothetical protein
MRRYRASGGVLEIRRVHPPMRELVAFIQANARPNDVIVQMMPDVYTEFATLYRSGVPVYGLPREAPLRPELMRVLERLARGLETNGLAFKKDRSLEVRQNAGQDFHQRGLARAVLAQ